MVQPLIGPLHRTRRRDEDEGGDHAGRCEPCPIGWGAYGSTDLEDRDGDTERDQPRDDTALDEDIEKEEPLKRQLLAFIECARAGLQPKVSGFEATAALDLAVEITKRIESAQ